MAKHFVGSRSQELLGLFVENAHPGIGSRIPNGSRKDPLSVAVGIGTVAAIAVPASVRRLVDLAPISAGVVRVGTRRVPGPALLVLFQKDQLLIGLVLRSMEEEEDHPLFYFLSLCNTLPT